MSLPALLLNCSFKKSTYRNDTLSFACTSVLVIFHENSLLYRLEKVSQMLRCHSCHSQSALRDDNAGAVALSEAVTFSDEKSDPSDDEEEGNRGGMSSDGDWNPTEELLVADELTKESEEETEDEGEEEDFESPGGLEINELCTECGRFFLILKPHTCEHKIKPYSCNICGKRCVSEIALRNHSEIHDETYEHPCKYCYVTFKTRADKFRHELTHQDKKDPFKCPDCPKTFATSKERRSHLAKHRVSREFKCGVCGIDFKDIHRLRRHSVVHTGLKPYKCSVCQRGFNQTSHLKSHMRLHTGERPYKCQLCDMCFNHNVSLKSHVQRYHTSSSGLQQMDKRANDAKRNKKKRDVNSEFDSVKVKQKVQRERSMKPKSKRRSTDRPRGIKSKVQKLKKTGSGDEGSEDKQSGSDLSFDSTEEEEEEEKEEEETLGRRPNGDSDSDFDPEVEAKKKRCSSQKTVKKRRERSKKGLVV